MEDVRLRLAKYRSDKYSRQPANTLANTEDNSEQVLGNRIENEYPSTPTALPKPGPRQNSGQEITSTSGRTASYLTSYQSLVLKSLVWLGLFAGFIYCGLGTVYVLLSAFYFVYRSMNRGGRKAGDVSAYSVFNKNFKRLDGTLTADQFDKEIRFQT